RPPQSPLFPTRRSSDLPEREHLFPYHRSVGLARAEGHAEDSSRLQFLIGHQLERPYTGEGFVVMERRLAAFAGVGIQDDRTDDAAAAGQFKVRLRGVDGADKVGAAAVPNSCVAGQTVIGEAGCGAS